MRFVGAIHKGSEISRVAGKFKHVTVGRHGKITPDKARRDAVKILTRIKAGLPPVETEPEASAPGESTQSCARLSGKQCRNHSCNCRYEGI